MTQNQKRLIIGGTVTLVAVAWGLSGDTMFELRTEIHIEAPPQAVWQALTDAEQFPTWNPFIHRMEGELQPGATLEVEVRPPGKSGMRFQPTVLKVAPNQELRWLGRTGVRGIMDGEHVFELQPTEAGTRFVHWERFSGLLVPLFRLLMAKDTQTGFEAMNAALKARVEADLLANR